MFLADVMDIVRRDERKFELAGEFDELAVDLLLVVNAVILNFKAEILLPEDIEVLGKSFAGGVLPLVEERAGNFALDAGGHGDQAFAVRGKKLLVGPGLVIEPAQLGVGNDFAEVDVAGLIRRQQNQVIPADVRNRGVMLKLAVRGDIDFAPDNRFDARFAHFLIEFDCAAHDAVIGHGDCGGMVFKTHLEKVAFLFKRLFILDAGSPRNGGSAVEKAVIRMDMQVYELLVRSDDFWLWHVVPL